MLPIRISESIVLKQIQDDHAAEMFAVIDSNRLYLRQWLGWLDKTLEVEDSRKFIAELQATFEQSAAFVCGIWYDDQLCGLAGYNAIDWENRSANLGYWIAEDYQGRGIITECCRFLIDHAFTRYDLGHLEIHVATENHRSQAVAERLGFTAEGLLKNAEWLYDHNVDHTINVLRKPVP